MSSPDGVYYQSNVTSVGEEVGVMAADGVLIFFGDPAPPELAEVSVLHAPAGQPEATMEVGDRLGLGASALTITAIGEKADENLRTLGHVVVYCNPSGGTGLLPGAVHATGDLAVPDPGSPFQLRRVGSDARAERPGEHQANVGR